jgi:hypothetical protein
MPSDNHIHLSFIVPPLAHRHQRFWHGNKRLADFVQQELLTLVNGFSNWPEEAACHRATVTTASELFRRADRTASDFARQNPPRLQNGFTRWPEEAPCRAIADLARELQNRDFQ